MTVSLTEYVRHLLGFLALALLASAPAQAQIARAEVVTEEYTPTIWVDPDGCEHWVFDDGFEGFMSPHRRRDGSPVCRRFEVCGVVMTDVFFDTNSAGVSAAHAAQLARFFGDIDVYAVMVHGHTDNRASDEYNMRLSQRRADAVASIAQSAGVAVLESRGFGERRPAEEGTSPAALQANRRVEIICLK